MEDNIVRSAPAGVCMCTSDDRNQDVLGWNMKKKTSLLAAPPTLMKDIYTHGLKPVLCHGPVLMSGGSFEAVSALINLIPASESLPTAANSAVAASDPIGCLAVPSLRSFRWLVTSMLSAAPTQPGTSHLLSCS